MSSFANYGRRAFRKCIVYFYVPGLLFIIIISWFRIHKRHVKIRQYKAVTGKCKACAMFSQARREQVSMRARAYVTSLFALHKITYTGERIAYASR